MTEENQKRVNTAVSLAFASGVVFLALYLLMILWNFYSCERLYLSGDKVIDKQKAYLRVYYGTKWETKDPWAIQEWERIHRLEEEKSTKFLHCCAVRELRKYE